MSRHLVLPILAALSLAACGSDDSGDPSDMTDDGPGDELLAPPPDGQGVQFAMTTSLEAGVEAEHCLFVQAPDQEMWVTRDEARFTQGSHHLLLYETDYEAIPTQRDDGTPVDTSQVFDCSDGATNGWSVTKLIGGSQNATGDSMIAFPDGVAMPVRPGAVLLLNVHYINATDEMIEPEARINLWTVPEEEVDTEGDLLFLYNPLIRVPQNGGSRAHWRCPVHEDITIANVQSHMHRRGVGYAAMIAGEEPFYDNDRWDNVEARSFDGGLRVSAGSSLEYYCDYQSSEARTVYQGPRSTDEMCMLIGSYYPADQRTANCLDDSGQNLAGEWIGEGTATCAETMTCVLGIDFTDPELDVLEPITDCMLAADPSVSRESSDFMLCLFSSDDPASDCGPQIEACQAK